MQNPPIGGLLVVGHICLQIPFTKSLSYDLFLAHGKELFCPSSFIWATSRENLSSGFLTKQVSNQSPQLQRLARELKFHQ